MEILIAADPYLNYMDLDHIKHIMSSEKFESFFFKIVHIEPAMEYVEIFQSYCILNVSGAEIEIWCTSPTKLKEFENDENQVKEDFRNLVSFKTTFVKGNDCHETSDIFIEA